MSLKRYQAVKSTYIYEADVGSVRFLKRLFVQGHSNTFSSHILKLIRTSPVDPRVEAFNACHTFVVFICYILIRRSLSLFCTLSLSHKDIA